MTRLAAVTGLRQREWLDKRACGSFEYLPDRLLGWQIDTYPSVCHASTSSHLRASVSLSSFYSRQMRILAIDLVSHLLLLVRHRR